MIKSCMSTLTLYIFIYFHLIFSLIRLDSDGSWLLPRNLGSPVASGWALGNFGVNHQDTEKVFLSRKPKLSLQSKNTLDPQTNEYLSLMRVGAHPPPTTAIVATTAAENIQNFKSRQKPNEW